LPYCRGYGIPISLQRLQITIGKNGDILVVRCGSHFGSGDATGAIQSWEHFGEPDHLAANGRIFLHYGHFEVLIGQVQRRLQSRNSTADHQSIEFHLLGHISFLSKLFNHSNRCSGIIQSVVRGQLSVAKIVQVVQIVESVQVVKAQVGRIQEKTNQDSLHLSCRLFEP
jgi:hypothetical protein